MAKAFRRLGLALLLVLGLAATGLAVSPSWTQTVIRAAAACQAKAEETTGYAVKRPVLGGACKVCPWGALAEVVQKAMKPYGYDVLICYHCARSEGPREVAARSMPPPWKTGMLPTMIIDSDIPPPPNGPLDFGVTSIQNLWWAYSGTHAYAHDKEGPRKNLRLIATIQQPNYLIVAARHELGITDLSQLKAKKWPVKILIDNNAASEVLDYYGLSKKDVEAAGGKVLDGAEPANRKDFDVIVYGGTLGNAPEFNVWYEVSQRFDLDYLQLPDALLDKIAKDQDMQRGTIPDGLLRGIHRTIPTVVRTGHAIYGRVDMPDQFAYDVAKAMDEQQGLLEWSNLPFSYNIHDVTQAFGVPLHPGAARYYRERGYLKATSTAKPTTKRPAAKAGLRGA